EPDRPASSAATLAPPHGATGAAVRSHRARRGPSRRACDRRRPSSLGDRRRRRDVPRRLHRGRRRGRGRWARAAPLAAGDPASPGCRAADGTPAAASDSRRPGSPEAPLRQSAL
ncbi:MAG: hypothetical protein AVDCRST_MAG67-3815, partial [uncultured Solirubrobacteraceae bacterium]